MTMSSPNYRNAIEIARRIGRQVAQSVQDDGLPADWDSLDSFDAGVMEAMGVLPGTPEWDAAEAVAVAAYMSATDFRSIVAEILGRNQAHGEHLADDLLPSAGCIYTWAHAKSLASWMDTSAADHPHPQRRVEIAAEIRAAMVR